MVCIRFSARSKTILAGDSKTSSVTSIPPYRPNSAAIFTQRGLLIMKCRQTVEELNLRITGQGHHFAIHLIVTQQGNTLRPFLFGLTHRYPDIGIDKVCAFNPRGDIFRQGDFTPCFVPEHCIRRPAQLPASMPVVRPDASPDR